MSSTPNSRRSTATGHVASGEERRTMSGSHDTAFDRIEVREVAGVFHSSEALEAAVDDLLRAGFDRSDIDLMADPETVHRKLGGIYQPVTELVRDPRVPRRAF